MTSTKQKTCSNCNTLLFETLYHFCNRNSRFTISVDLPITDSTKFEQYSNKTNYTYFPIDDPSDIELFYQLFGAVNKEYIPIIRFEEDDFWELFQSSDERFWELYEHFQTTILNFHLPIRNPNENGQPANQ